MILISAIPFVGTPIHQWITTLMLALTVGHSPEWYALWNPQPHHLCCLSRSLWPSTRFPSELHSTSGCWRPKLLQEMGQNGVTYAENITKNRQSNMGQKQWQLHLATDVATSRCWKMPSTPAPSPSPRRTFGKPALPGARDAWGGMLRETFEVQGQMNFWVFADNSWSVWARYCVDCTKRTSLQCHWKWWLVGITIPQQKVTVNCWLHPRNDSQLLIPQVIAGEKGFLARTCPSWTVPTRKKARIIVTQATRKALGFVLRIFGHTQIPHIVRYSTYILYYIILYYIILYYIILYYIILYYIILYYIILYYIIYYIILYYIILYYMILYYITIYIYVVLYIPLDPYTTWLDTHIHEQTMHSWHLFSSNCHQATPGGRFTWRGDWRNRNVSRRQKICCVGRWMVCGRRLESRRWRLGNGGFDGNFTVMKIHQD